MKNLFRAVCSFLCVCLILPFASCSKSPTAYKLGKTTFSEQTYAYYMACYKQYWLDVFGEHDEDAFWNSDYGGINAADYLQSVSENAIKARFVSAYLFDEYGLSLTSDEYGYIDELLSGMLAALDGEEGIKNDEMLSSLGMDKDDLRDILIIDSKAAALQDYLYGTNGKDPITDEDRELYYQNKYFRFKHFYLMNYDYEYNDDGSIVYDDEGYASVLEISDARWEEKLALANDVLARAKNGENFDDFILKYSEELSRDKYPNGHYLTVPNDYFTDISNAVTAAEIGDFVLFQSSLGVHIIQRLELDKGAWGNEDNKANGDFDGFDDLVLEFKFKALTNGYNDKIEISEDITGKYKLRDMPYSLAWYYFV